MALNTNALLTVQDVREYLDITAGSKPELEWLIAVINGVSTEVQDYTSRTYKPSDAVPATREYSYGGGLTVEIDDCRDITLIETTTDPNDAASWADIAASSYVALPLDESVKRRIRFKSTGSNALAFTYSQWPRELKGSASFYSAIRVTGLYGHVTVPPNVILACQMWIKNIFNRDQAYFSQEFSDGVIINREQMPPDVKQILDGQREQNASVAAV